MKFGELVLRVRGRLTDMRTPANVFITSAATDGKRWTADKLVGISKDAISETIRIIGTYANSPIVRQMGANSIITEAVYNLSGGRVTLPATALAVLSVVEYEGDPYGYIPPHLYTQYEVDDKLPRKGERFYTVFNNITTNNKTLAILPKTSAKVTCYLLYADTLYLVTDLNKKVPIYGLDDFIVDVAEREAREQEGNLDRAAVLDRRIQFKLGVGGQQ